MHDALWHHLIADRLSLARLVDKYKRIYAVVLFIGKAVRRTHRGKGCWHGGMARRELFEFCRLGGVRRTRGQCQQQIAKVFASGTGKNLSELITMSVSLPSGRRNLMAMPCGLASADPSGIFGMPVESENRTVAGIELPLNNTPRLSPAASGEALKLPSTTMPLA